MIDASRFLAQSQSRISFRQPDEAPRNPLDRARRYDQNPSRLNSRLFPRQSGQGSTFSQFPFASRSNAQAPLFYSATDDFREEDDEAEHEREVADFYALQRSRRQFVPQTKLEESSEVEDDGSRGSGLEESGNSRDAVEPTRPGVGIRSSWTGGRRMHRDRKPIDPVKEFKESNTRRDLQDSTAESQMQNIELRSTLRSELDQDDPPEEISLNIPEDEDPPSVQQFRKPSQDPFSPFSPREPEYARANRPPDPDSDTDSIPPTIGPSTDPPKHDVFWGNLYILALISLFASFFLVWLHTSNPKNPLGDTVYNVLHSSFYLLAVNTVVAIMLSLLWLAVLRSYVRQLVYIMLIAVPVILLSFSIYPFVESFQGKAHGSSVQDQAMRWLSPIPGVLAAGWVYGVWKGRRSFGKAIGILEFACRILAANPALLILGFGTLASIVLWTWLWMGMFTRVFLRGHLTGKLFVIDVGTWWLGVFYIMIYLWTLGVESGIQRSTTAATVSQWYFHRLAEPAPTSREVVSAAVAHSLTTLFGTICLSTLLSLLARLPVLILPKQFVALVGLCSYTLLPNSVLILTHPTTLTYSAIHSQPLGTSARAVSQLSFMGPSNPVTNNRFRSHRSQGSKTSSIPAYNIAFLLLHATRLIASFAFGFGTWVTAARSITINDSASGIRGSLYAYIVGLIAGAIGWGVLGAMEGVLTGIVDAVVVCWASEIRNGEVKYCREAGWLLGDGSEEPEDREGLLGRRF